MKKIVPFLIISLLILGGCGSSDDDVPWWAAVSNVTISNVVVDDLSSAGADPVTGDVKVTFDITVDGISPSDVLLEYKGGSVGETWTSVAAKGESTALTTGTGKSIVWNSSTYQAGAASASYSLRLSPSGLVNGAAVTSSAFNLDNTGSERYWAKAYGVALQSIVGRAVSESLDGTYFVAGENNDGFSRLWVAKLGSDGTALWDKKFSAAVGEARAVAATPDGGCVVAGVYDSKPAIFRLSSAGAVSWFKTYDTAGYFSSIRYFSDTTGEYMVAAGKNSGNDAWLLKLTSSGAVGWQYSYGSDSEFNSIRQTSDLGYIACGTISTRNNDIWVVRLSSAGGVVWQQAFDWAASAEVGFDAQPMANGGYVVLGNSDQRTKDAVVFVLKSDGSVDLTWNQGQAAILGDTARAEMVIGGGLRQNSDGSFMVATDTPVGAGSRAIWFFKLSNVANNAVISQQLTMAGDGADDVRGLIATTYSDIVMVGSSTSNFAPGVTGTQDLWTLRVAASGACNGFEVPINVVASVYDQTLLAATTNATPTATGAVPAALSLTPVNTSVVTTTQAP